VTQPSWMQAETPKNCELRETTETLMPFQMTQTPPVPGTSDTCVSLQNVACSISGCKHVTENT